MDTRKVLRLRNIIERTGAKLVLSSSWRTGRDKHCLPFEKFGYLELIKEFNRLRCPLWIDTTPVLCNSKREREIYTWLFQHPEVEDFVILDDVGEELTFWEDHLVLTTWKEGLTQERAELAVSMLGGK